ncbi:MAG: DUF6624 domain-containing protein [Bacteroidia bacterium]
MKNSKENQTGINSNATSLMWLKVEGYQQKSCRNQNDEVRDSLMWLKVNSFKPVNLFSSSLMLLSLIVILCLVFTTTVTFAQMPSQEYMQLTAKADSMYDTGDFKASAFLYSEAFKADGWKGFAIHRYNAACSWALAGYIDSAFFNLYIIAEKAKFSDYNHIKKDTDMTSLYSDMRWLPLLAMIKENKHREEANLNHRLVRQLDKVFDDDQKYRQQLFDTSNKYGNDSREAKEIWKIIDEKDAANVIKVTKILDKHGWLGPDVIWDKGNMTLFLVIQHADAKTQEKYLPVMREAVKNGKAQSSQLALLEDRVALSQGKKQIYGSQINMDEKTGKYIIAPIEDETNVNERRASVGLGPLEDYVKQWDIAYTLPKN